jgi:hypothetical protein
MTSAATALALVALALLIAGAFLVWAEPRVGARMPVRAGTVLVIATLVAGLAAGVVATHGDPVGRADNAWKDFKDFRTDVPTAKKSRFGDLSSVRYDLWRVGLNAWKGKPLTGIGQDNFAGRYTRDRKTPYFAPRWLHSFELRVLVHTGLVGAALMLLFLGATALGALRGPPGETRAIAAIALLPAVDWLAHGSVDWLWEYPALAAPALGFAGLGLALGDQPGATSLSIPVRRRTIVRAGFVGVAIAGTLAIGPAYLAELQDRRAITGWGENPARAFKRLDRAESLNPLDAHAALVDAAIAVHLGDVRRAREAFVEASQRDPDSWLAPFELGLIADDQGDRAAAERRLRGAHERNPLSAIIADALRRVKTDHPMTLAEGTAAVAQEAIQQGGGQ